MEEQSIYNLAGFDLGPAITAWLDDIIKGGGVGRTLLEHAIANTHPGDDLFYSATFLMGNVAPDAADPEATPEVLLIYAVLTIHQNSIPKETPGLWHGFEGYVRDAFERVQAMGRTSAAEALLRPMIQNSTAPNQDLQWMRRAANPDPAKYADHERHMASIWERNVRAAKILDPAVDLDDLLLREISGD
ncbi:hypothetical protein [Nocardia salmonicida]|uniref:hypothetical protein n=1 Tax=Nocardia salmonicida TaxID=53431 RepID=UPI0033CA1FB9